VLGRFHLLKPCLALVLAFVGAKMLASGWIKVPIGLSLGVIVVLLGGSVAASLLFPPRGEKEAGAAGPPAGTPPGAQPPEK
jgi:tellurite resistance protein TerC